MITPLPTSLDDRRRPCLRRKKKKKKKKGNPDVYQEAKREDKRRNSGLVVKFTASGTRPRRFKHRPGLG